MTASPALTDRQWELLNTLCFGGPRRLGLSNCEAAAELGLTADGFKNSMSVIYRKLERVGAIRRKRSEKKVLACVYLARVELAMQTRRAG